MIVVLILTTIVVGLAFSVLTLVQKHMRGIQSNFYNTTELKKLETSLWLDFNRYSTITYNEIDNELKFKNELDSTVYKFSQNKIIKQQDTFAMALENKTLFFDGNSIENGQLDAIKIKSSKAFRNKKIFIYKHNDASVFMK